MPILYNFGVFFIKLSLLLFYGRIFGHDRKLKNRIKGLIAFQAIYTVGFSEILVFICTPLEAWWDLPLRADHCPNFSNTMTIYVILRSISVFREVLVLCLPMKLVSGLMIPVKQKLKLLILFPPGMTYDRSVVSLSTPLNHQVAQLKYTGLV